MHDVGREGHLAIAGDIHVAVLHRDRAIEAIEKPLPIFAKRIGAFLFSRRDYVEDQQSFIRRVVFHYAVDVFGLCTIDDALLQGFDLRLIGAFGSGQERGRA
jgi:hypothetical protein